MKAINESTICQKQSTVQSSNLITEMTSWERSMIYTPNSTDISDVYMG